MATIESRRPIIFIAYSLGGIVVKQALVWANREPRYSSIKDHTLGIVFFGTPHRGSDKANYGKILANVATGVMRKPKSKLISALQSNSEMLMKLTSEFKFEAPNVEIMTFYETKSISIFSSLIVDKQSALLELSHEDTQPVDANHRDMCKFESQNDDTYKKLVKRLNRMLKGKDRAFSAPDFSPTKFHNKYFELPFDVSTYFTGGEDLCSKLYEKCLPSAGPSTGNPEQKRFVLYGLGGSGKTQMALKFASDHRERFWGIFFIDISSASTAEQAFSTMAGRCKVGNTMEDFKRYLTKSLEPWLLILDNADDPLLDISPFLPVGNRGTIIITSRNPECRCHATVGHKELREMKRDEAVTLLLRSGDLHSEDENLRDLALPIVQSLGYLALAVNHAGASIRQRTCSLGNYLDIYTRHRKKLLSSRPVQAGLDYKYTVYTTWEMSVDSIKKLAKNATDSTATNALELLTLFGFCHFDDITEGMFRSAWERFDRTEEHPWWASNLLGIIRDRRSSNWNSLGFNEAIQLLSSYSLIQVSGPDNRVSLHPLVHSWIRDSLNGELYLRWWNTTISTLALAVEFSMSHLNKQLRVHLRHCISIGQVDDLFGDDGVPLDKVQVTSLIINVYSDHPWEDAVKLSERALKYSRRIFGDECYPTCLLSYQLARGLNFLQEYQKTSDLLRDKLDVSIRVVGASERLTFLIMGELSWTYRCLGRKQEALELAQKTLAICEKSLDERDAIYLDALDVNAQVYLALNRNEEAIDGFKRVLAKKNEILNEEDSRLPNSEFYLASAYSRSGQHQAALEMFQSCLKKDSGLFGEDHPYTLEIIVCIAVEYGLIGQPEKGIPLIVRAIDIGSGIGYDRNLEIWKDWLEWLESEGHRSDEKIPTRKRWRLGRKFRHPEVGTSS